MIHAPGGPLPAIDDEADVTWEDFDLFPPSPYDKLKEMVRQKEAAAQSYAARKTRLLALMQKATLTIDSTGEADIIIISMRGFTVTSRHTNKYATNENTLDALESFEELATFRGILSAA